MKWFERCEAADPSATLTARLADVLHRKTEKQIASLDSLLSKVRNGRSAGLSWAFGDADRTGAIEKTLAVPPGTLRAQLERLQRAGRAAVRWRLDSPPIFALSLNEPDGELLQPADRGNKRSERRRTTLARWLAELRGLDPEPSVVVSITGPPGSGRSWLAAKLRREGVDADVERVVQGADPSNEDPRRHVVIETAPWGPSDVEQLVANLTRDERRRVQDHLVTRWGHAVGALPDELRRPARLIALVERALVEPVSVDPGDIRRVELELRITEARERVSDLAVADVRTLVTEIGMWWVDAGPGSIVANTDAKAVEGAVAEARSGATIPRGEIPTAELFAALEGDDGARQVLLNRLSVRAKAPEVVAALVDAGLLVRDGDLMAWTDDGRAAVRLLLASHFDVDAAARAELVWTEEDRRLLADSAVFHGRGVRALVEAMDKRRGRRRVGVYLAALDLALALGTDRVSAEEIEEAWLGALYGVALDAVPGFEWDVVERLVMEVSKLFRDVLPRFENSAHRDITAKVDQALRRDLAVFGPWDSELVRGALPRLCVWQLSTSELAEHLVGPYALREAASEVLLARARAGEADAIAHVVLPSSRFRGSRPLSREVAEWAKGVPLSAEVVSCATRQACAAISDSPDNDAKEALAIWLARWPDDEVAWCLLDAVGLDPAWLDLDALPERIMSVRSVPPLAGAMATTRLAPAVVLDLAERLGAKKVLRLVARCYGDPGVLDMRLRQSSPLDERRIQPLETALRLRHDALLALVRLGDLELPRASIEGGPLRVVDDRLGRDLCLWHVLADRNSADRAGLFPDNAAWTALQKALSTHPDPNEDVFVRAMGVAHDQHQRAELWPHIAWRIWDTRDGLDHAFPEAWRRPSVVEEPADYDRERWEALLNRDDEVTLARWLDRVVRHQPVVVADLGRERLQRPPFREALWRAAKGDRDRRELAFKQLRWHRSDLALERGWLQRAAHTFETVPRWLEEYFVTPAERERADALAALDETSDPLEILRLTLVAYGGWTDAGEALVAPAALALHGSPASSGEHVARELEAICKYDDDRLADLYASAFRWTKRLQTEGASDLTSIIVADRQWLAERGYGLGVLGDADLDDEDRCGAVIEIALTRTVSSASLEALWSMLSTLPWGEAANTALARLRAELGNRFDATVLDRAATADTWGGIWEAAIEGSFATAPAAWDNRLRDLKVWRSDPGTTLGVLNRCVYRLGPSHPAFVRLNRKLDEVAFEHLKVARSE